MFKVIDGKVMQKITFIEEYPNIKSANERIRELEDRERQEVIQELNISDVIVVPNAIIANSSRVTLVYSHFTPR